MTALLLVTLFLGSLAAVGIPAPVDENRAIEILAPESQNSPGDPLQGIIISLKTLDAAKDRTCMILKSGKVACMGANGAGQTGPGSVAYKQSTPNIVDTGRAAVSIATADHETCAVHDDGSVACWGAGKGLGSVGIGTSNPAVSVVAGSDHFCALLIDGAVSCWGDNTYGQVGHSLTEPMSGEVKEYDYSSAGTDDQENEATSGRDVGGHLMVENTGVMPGPVDLGVGRTAVALSAGPGFTCAITDLGMVMCWGRNDKGQLGHGTDEENGETTTSGRMGKLFLLLALAAAPNPVDLPEGRTAVAISAGGGENGGHACAILDDGGLTCWGQLVPVNDGTDGRNFASSLIIPMIHPPTLNIQVAEVEEVSTGGGHDCVITTNGDVQCWGANSDGQLGQGYTSNHESTPQTVDLGGRMAVSVSTGDHHTCVIIIDGTTECFGGNSEGQLGTGTTSVDESTPTRPSLGGSEEIQMPTSQEITRPMVVYPVRASLGYGVRDSAVEVVESPCNGGYAISVGGLPAGLALNAETGAIEGTPTEVGEDDLRVSCSDGEGVVQTSNDIKIEITSSIPWGLSHDKTSAAIRKGAEFDSGVPTVEGGPVTGFLIDRAPPAGLEFDADTGAISGRATKTDQIGGLYIITATSDAGSTSTPLWIRVLGESSEMTYTLGKSVTPRYKMVKLQATDFTATRVSGEETGGCVAVFDWKMGESRWHGLGGGISIAFGDGDNSYTAVLGDARTNVAGGSGTQSMELGGHINGIEIMSITQDKASTKRRDNFRLEELSITLSGNQWDCEVEPHIEPYVEQAVGRQFASAIDPSDVSEGTSVFVIALISLGTLIVVILGVAFVREHRRRKQMAWAEGIQQVFDDFDQDADGSLSRDEIDDWVRKRVDSEITVLLETFDTDRDGAISKEEILGDEEGVAASSEDSEEA